MHSIITMKPTINFTNTGGQIKFYHHALYRNRNFRIQTDSVASKIDKIQQFIIIPHKDLHPDLKSPAEHVKYQNWARIGGAFLYPLISMFGFPSMILWTPFCVGTHHTSLRFAYKAALESFKLGDIVMDPHLNQELREKMAAKKLSRFHINYRGDLVVHLEAPATFSLSKFKGISFQETTQNNSFMHRINTIRNQVFSKGTSEISYFHLEEDIQKQVGRTLIARQLRFRACMGTVLVSSILGASHDILTKASVLLPIYISTALVIQGDNLPNFKVEERTDDLMNLIFQKNAFTDLIKPKYRALYQKNDFNEKSYIYLSTIGNIRFSDKIPFSFRKLYKNKLNL